MRHVVYKSQKWQTKRIEIDNFRGTFPHSVALPAIKGIIYTVLDFEYLSFETRLLINDRVFLRLAFFRIILFIFG